VSILGDDERSHEDREGGPMSYALIPVKQMSDAIAILTMTVEHGRLIEASPSNRRLPIG